MTNANTFHSAMLALLIFAGIYFVVLGIYLLKKWIKKHINKKEDES